MGLLNKLFEKKSASKKLNIDADAAWKAWQQHVKSLEARYKFALMLHFSETPKFINDSEKIDSILEQIQETISEDILTIKSELRDESAVYKDLRNCADATVKYYDFTNSLLKEKDYEKRLVDLFKHLFKVIQSELHTIAALRRRLKEKQPVVVEDLMDVMTLVWNERKLLEPFQQYGAHLQQVERISKGVFAGEIVKKKVEKAEKDFVESMIAEMGSDEAKGMRALGMDIYGDILKQLGAPFKDYAEFEPKIDELGKLATDSTLIENLVRKKRPKYSDEKVKLIVKAFIEAYKKGHFEDMNVDLYK